LASGLAPLNPNFLYYFEDIKLGKIQKYTPTGDWLGYIPPPLDLSHMTGQPIFLETYQLLSYPASYDLRTQGKVTPIKNQGPCGSCWSFATYGSLESSLLTSETWDFSENNLKNTHGFDMGHCDGGNHNMSTAYLARWGGPISEADDPYNPTSNSSPSGLSVQKHAQDVLFLPDRAGPLDNDTIKQAVMTYGAVYTTMYWSSSYWNEANDAYYYTGTTYANHAVAIVGWDNDFPKTNFKAPNPPDNGAFIIKNSWGTGFGINGYFYISYYDSNIGKDNAVFTAEQTANYNTSYQYDPLGWIGSYGYGSNTGWFANIFTASSNEQIAAVSFYAASPDSSYEIYIYKDISPGQPKSGSLAGSKTGTIRSAGYHTIPLDSLIDLTPDQKFSAVVKLSTPGYNYPIPLEYPYFGYSSLATANAGESYVSHDGNSWSDITNSHPNTNVCLKAFTVTQEGTTQYTLTVNKSGTGSGTITSTASGINCGDDCNEIYLSGTSITLTAEPLSGATFSSWNGCDSSSGTTCHVTMTSDRNIIATFTQTSVIILQPNGGEVIPSGSTYEVQWRAPSKAVTFTLLYSLNNGTTWNLIKRGIIDKSFNWAVPTPWGNRRKCLLKVIGYDASGMKLSADKSDAPFKIEVVKLTSPNGGTLTSGKYSITWTTNQTKKEVAKVKLYYT
jgi:C1A family cysteine protease